MDKEYVYALIDDNEGQIGLFTTEEKAKQAAIDGSWCESYYDDEITAPQQVFDECLMTVEKIPLNQIFY